MKKVALLGVGFVIGWTVLRVVFGIRFGGASEEELIRDSAHEFGSSTGG